MDDLEPLFSDQEEVLEHARSLLPSSIRMVRLLRSQAWDPTQSDLATKNAPPEKTDGETEAHEQNPTISLSLGWSVSNRIRPSSQPQIVEKEVLLLHAEQLQHQAGHKLTLCLEP